MVALFQAIFSIIFLILSILAKDIVTFFFGVGFIVCSNLYIFENTKLDLLAMTLHFSTIVYLALFIKCFSPFTYHYYFVLAIDIAFFMLFLESSIHRIYQTRIHRKTMH